MKKKSLIATVATVACIAAIGVGSTFAYFTDHTDVLSNVFVMGEGVDIELEEVQWNTNLPESKKLTVAPNQIVVKDPTVKNLKNDAAVVIKVEVPQYKATATATETADLYAFTANTSLTLVDAVLSSDKKTKTYTYSVVMEKDAKKIEVFVGNEVTVANVDENAIFEEEATVKVSAYATQTEGFVNNGVVDSAKVLDQFK